MIIISIISIRSIIITLVIIDNILNAIVISIVTTIVNTIKSVVVVPCRLYVKHIVTTVNLYTPNRPQWPPNRP